MRDTWELDNRESVQYKELVTELTTEVRHCLRFKWQMEGRFLFCAVLGKNGAKE